MRKWLIVGGAVVAVVVTSSVLTVGVGAQRLTAPTEPAHGEALLQPDLGPESSERSLRSARAEPAAEENDDLVPVALATFGVAAAAMGVGALAYLVRLRLGLVKPPPAPPEERHESH